MVGEPVRERHPIEARATPRAQRSQDRHRTGNGGPLGHAEVRVGGERLRQVDRAGQSGGGAEQCRPSVSGEDRDPKERLAKQVAVRPQHAHEPNVGRAAAKEHVLPVVELPALVIGEAERPSAEEGATLHECHLGAEPDGLAGCGDPRQAAATDDDSRSLHLVSATEALVVAIRATFFLAERDALPAKMS